MRVRARRSHGRPDDPAQVVVSALPEPDRSAAGVLGQEVPDQAGAVDAGGAVSAVGSAAAEPAVLAALHEREAHLSAVRARPGGRAQVGVRVVDGLGGLVDTFTEGFATPHLVEALDAMGEVPPRSR